MNKFYCMHWYDVMMLMHGKSDLQLFLLLYLNGKKHLVGNIPSTSIAIISGHLLSKILLTC